MSNAPYATKEDLQKRWIDMPAMDPEHVDAVLSDASTLLRAQLPPIHKVNQEILEMITCQIARRALATSTVPEGVTSVSQTVGPFATQMGFNANNSGSLYLTKAEKKLLGIGRQTADNIDLLGGRDATPTPWTW